MSATATAPAAETAKKGTPTIVWVVVCLLAAGAGYFFPKLSANSDDESHSEEKPKKTKTQHAAYEHVPIAFGDATVNLAEDRMTRYLRVKIVLLVNREKETEMNELLNKKRAAMKNWLLSHLSNKRLTEVAGGVGVKRLQREILERFDEMLFPHGDDHLADVLFEEFIVQ